MIFLRPNEKSQPTRYVDSVEKAGLVVSGKHSIAMYICRSGQNIGPAGPQGEPGVDGVDQNSWFDTIIAADAYHSEWDALTVRPAITTFRSPYPLDLTLGYVRVSLTTAPTGSPLIIDVRMNGTSLFSTPIYIDEGSLTSVGSSIPAVLSTLYIPDDAEFKVDVIQIGSLEAGRGVKVAVTGIKTT